MTKQATPKYIPLAQFCEERGVSDRTGRRWIADGRLKAVRFSERCIRISVDEAARFDAKASGDIGPDAA